MPRNRPPAGGGDADVTRRPGRPQHRLLIDQAGFVNGPPVGPGRRQERPQTPGFWLCEANLHCSLVIAWRSLPKSGGSICLAASTASTAHLPTTRHRVWRRPGPEFRADLSRGGRGPPAASATLRVEPVRAVVRVKAKAGRDRRSTVQSADAVLERRPRGPAPRRATRAAEVTRVPIGARHLHRPRQPLRFPQGGALDWAPGKGKGVLVSFWEKG